MKKTVALLLAILIAATVVPFFVVSAADKGAPSDFGSASALYAHAVSNSADTQAWQAWQSVHDEAFVEEKPNEKYFFLPSSAGEAVIDVYNGFEDREPCC